MIRRMFDILVSTAALALSSPMLLAAIVAIKLESRGPAIYRQRRSGLRGAPFDMLKLRTMVDGAEHIGAGLAVNENDSRITRVGAFLRRTSLAAGLWDWLRHGTEASWDVAEGTR